MAKQEKVKLKKEKKKEKKRKEEEAIPGPPSIKSPTAFKFNHHNFFFLPKLIQSNSPNVEKTIVIPDNLKPYSYIYR